MNLNNMTTTKVLVGLSLASLIALLGFVLISLIFYQETHEDCLTKCKQKYLFNIDNSWIACDQRCDKRFEKQNENR